MTLFHIGKQEMMAEVKAGVKPVNSYLAAALRLHSYLLMHHLEQQALVGPDPGVRFNYRIGRFVKSSLRKIDWRDRYYYLQAQAYWVLANWSLFDMTQDVQYRALAMNCAETILLRQRDDGAWDYPNPEWKGRIATVEGAWAALGLLVAYQRTRLPEYLTGALRWHEYMVSHIGFQQIGDELAVNYFAGRAQARVPNNATLVLILLARLAQLTGERRYLEPAQGLLVFLQRAQLASGELPYAVGNSDNPGYYRQHLQCYQYNAFQCLELIAYYESTGDETAKAMVERLLPFLSQGLAADGHAYYDCSKPARRVVYHAAALGAAFTQAGRIGLAGYDELAERAFGYVLASQRTDGGFWHSERDYRILADRRSYPRYLSMILLHLLMRAAVTVQPPTGIEPNAARWSPESAVPSPMGIAA